jgi:small-conductance mechanosensitive channel
MAMRLPARSLRMLLLLAFLAPVWAFAADAPAPPAAQTAARAVPAASPAVETAPAPGTLRFFNRGIVTFRAPYFGYPPAERAANGAQRIRDALAKGGPGKVNIVGPTAEGLTVTVDGIYVFKILQDDLDADDGQTFDQARTIVGGRLEEAIGAARESLRGKDLLHALGWSVAATLGLVIVLWALLRTRLWLRRRIDAILARRLQLQQQERGALARLAQAFGRFAFAAVALILIEEWLRFLFGLFPYTRPWSSQLTLYVVTVLEQVLAAAVAATPGLVMVAVIIGLASLGTKVIRTISRGIEANRFQLFGIDSVVVHPARRLVTSALWLFALAMAYPYLPGSSSEAFKGLTVLVGLMVSLGVSGMVGQAAGGFILTFSRVLRVGEWVRIGEVEGAVASVGAFSTRIRTSTDEEVSIPNTVVLGTITRNFSRPLAAEGSTLETVMTIGYNTPWRQVHAMLLEAATRTPELEHEPPPYVLQTALSDFYVQYSLRVRLRNQLRRPAVLSVLNANIQDVFNEYGVQILSPHYQTDPDAPAVVPKERWFEPPAAPPGGRS